ncbi:MAG: sulfatase [Myxococcota bacterium]
MLRLARLALLSLLALACGPAPAERPPDVVLIELSSVRADHVGHLGYALPTSRGLDGLRDRSVLFAAARSPSSSSVVASAGLLTGLLPTRLGFGGPAPRLPADVPTLAARLRAAGWTTVGHSQHAGIGTASALDRGFDVFHAANAPPGEHPDARLLVDWMREWLSVEAPSPFFLYLHVMSAHAPYRVPADRRSALLGRPPSDAMPYDGPLARAARRPGRRRAADAVGEREVASLVEHYDTALRYGFDRTGQMLALLDQAGRLDGAIVVVTSDHGEELFDRGGFDHGRTLHEEVLRVPLYWKLPGDRGGAPRRIDAPVSTLDVMPTLLDWLGLPVPESDGVSLLPLLRGEVDAPPERPFPHVIAGSGAQSLVRALHHGRHKLIDTPGRPALYDLALDPGERENLADGSTDTVRALRRTLNEVLPPAAAP